MWATLWTALRASPAALWPPALANLAILAALCALTGWVAAAPLARALAQGWGERLLLWVLAGVALVSWVGTILAVLGLFRPWIVLAALVLSAAWARWLAGRSVSPSVGGARRAVPLQAAPPLAAQTPWLAQGALALGLLLAAWLYVRPAESVLLFDDPSVYTVGGIALARQGSLWAQVDPFWQTWLPQSPQNPLAGAGASALERIAAAGDLVRQFGYLGHAEVFGIPARHYGPFYQWALDNPTLEIGFLPLPKVWTALCVWLFGEASAASAAPLFAWLGLASLYVLARRCLGWRTGLLAVALWAGAVPQVWFARLDVAEIYAQVLILGGLALLITAREASEEGPRTGGLLWSALLLGALAVARLEGVALIVLLAVLARAASAGPEGRRALRPWLAALAAAGLVGLAIALGVARYYLFTRSLTLTPSITRAALGALALAILSGISIWRLGWWPSLRARLARLPGARLLALALLLGWAAWGLAALMLLMTRAAGASLPGWLTFYWTRPGLALSLLGILWLCGEAWRDPQRRLAPELAALLGLGGALLLAFTANPLVNPVQPWAVRRLVPAVLPTLALVAAYPLARGWELAAGLAARSHGMRRALLWSGAALLVALAGVQVGGIALRTLPILWHQERQGLWRQVRALGERFAPDALLLFDDGPASQGLTSVMELLLGHPAAVIYQAAPGELPFMEEVLARAQAQRRPTYLLLSGGHLDWRPDRWQFESVGATCLRFPMLRQQAGRPPQADDVTQQELCLDTYRIVPVGQGAAPRAWQGEYSIGQGSYPYVRAGFYGYEREASGAARRWTDGEALLTLPWPAEQANAPASACLTLTVAGGRPVGEQQVALRIAAEGQGVFQGELPPGFAPHALDVPLRGLANVGEPVLELQLASGTFQPPGDARTLGIQVLGARLAPLDVCVAGD